MNHPKLLQTGDTIGVCAPSSGTPGEQLALRFDNAVHNVKALGYNVIETASVRRGTKLVSADAKTRADEFTKLYENPLVAAIIPPWGGEFLMDMLPELDFERLRNLPPKWVCGYSDISTLTFVMMLMCDVATVHGSNFMNMGFARIHETDMRAFEVMSNHKTVQKSWNSWGGFTDWNDLSKEIYTLDKPSVWKSLRGETEVSFEGMMIGGCMDTLCKLIGTRFAPVEAFLEKYKQHGFIWTLESCEMAAPDIYRTLWQMRECGWFKYCNGIIIGRPDGYGDKRDFTLTDALQQGLGDLNVPILYDADIGHLPPQIQIVNGAYGRVDFTGSEATVEQELI